MTSLWDAIRESLDRNETLTFRQGDLGMEIVRMRTFPDGRTRTLRRTISRHELRREPSCETLIAEHVATMAEEVRS